MTHPILPFLQTIPQGKVVSYKQLSERFKIHPRVVAKILASNQEQDIYPCFLVVRSDGKLSGYNLGIEEKRKRLSTW